MTSEQGRRGWLLVGGKKDIYYLAANYLATAISIHEIAVWLKGLVNQIDNGLELGGWKRKGEGNKMSQTREVAAWGSVSF